MPIFYIDSLSANTLSGTSVILTTVSATTYLGNASNLSNIPTITGGTYNSSNGTITFTNNTGGTFSVSGITSSGATIMNGLNTYVTTDGGGVQINISSATLDTLVVTSSTVSTTISANTITGNSANIPHLLNVHHIQYDINNTAHTFSEGTSYWNADDKTLVLDTDVTNFEIAIGQQEVVRVTNKTGSLISEQSVVYVNGAQGNRPTINLASMTGNSTTNVIGFVAKDIANNGTGYVITGGLLKNIDTSAYSAGTELFLYTGGTITSTQPTAPNHLVRLGFVITSHANQGVILVNIINGFELGQLHDVYINNISNNDIIKWNSSNSRWENNQLPTDIKVTGGTYSNGNLLFTNNTGGTFTVTGVSGTNPYIVSGSYNSTGGTLTLNDNLGGGILITGFTTGGSITNTTTIDFGDESDFIVTTVTGTTQLTNSNFKSFKAIPSGTTETSLDDFSLNGVIFNIENIIDNTSFDIRATALNNASGTYTIKYIINY